MSEDASLEQVAALGRQVIHLGEDTADTVNEVTGRFRDTTKWLAGLLPIAGVVAAGTATVPTLIAHEGGRVLVAWLLTAAAVALAAVTVVAATRILSAETVGWLSARSLMWKEYAADSDSAPNAPKTLLQELADDFGLADGVTIADGRELLQAMEALEGTADGAKLRTLVRAVATRRAVQARFSRFLRTAAWTGPGMLAALIAAAVLAGTAPQRLTGSDIDTFAAVTLIAVDGFPTDMVDVCPQLASEDRVDGFVLDGTTMQLSVIVVADGCDPFTRMWSSVDGLLLPR